MVFLLILCIILFILPFSSYVRENYFNYIPGLDETPAPTTTPAGHVNWVTYTFDKGVANYVPMELIHGLINCGREYSLYGINSPDWLNALLHTDFSVIPGVGECVKLIFFNVTVNKVKEFVYFKS